MICKGSDLQNAGDGTALLSSGYCSAGGILVTQSNLWKVAIAFACRRVVKKTWLNDRDQFLIPTVLLPEEFKSDCLVWMLFNGSNLTAGADGLEWNGKTWSLINHFIPFTEQEVGAPGRFESGFMAEYIADLTLSPEALAVMDAGRAIWHQYFAVKDTHKVRTDLKLNRSDVGWYQIRNAIGARNASGDAAPVSFDAFEAAYKALGDKIRPQVYELGFLMTDVPRPTAPVEIAEVLLAEAAD
jgi:hypothetical protein